MNGSAEALPQDYLKMLATAAQSAGVAVPAMDRIAPTIDVTLPIRELSIRVGELVRHREIFLRGMDVVTIDHETSAAEVMTAGKFCGWIEEWAVIKCGRSVRVRESLTREEAALLLEQKLFRSHLRRLNAVHEMRLPVRRASGKWDFLPKGYDAESGIYTTGVIDYEMDWNFDRSRKFIDEHLEEYPFAWPDGLEDKGLPIHRNRSAAVVLAMMLGFYLRAGFQPGTPMPMIAGLGNQAGTGKTTLIAMATCPVFGHCTPNSFPKDDDKFESEMDATVLAGSPFLFFDDIGRGLFNNRLNTFITSGSKTGRILGTKDKYTAKHSTQVLATGRDIKISDDLMRRSLIFEMFLARDVQGRKFKRDISAQYLAAQETRRNFLAAMCGLVKWGILMQQAVAEGKAPRPEITGLATFKDWTETVAGFVLSSGYENPLTPPELSAGGAEDDEELRTLLIKLASESEGDVEFDRGEMVAKARSWGLLEDLVGLTDEKMDASQLRRWGRKLQSWRGRELQDERGRMFRFGYRRKNVGAKYPLTFLATKSPV